MTRRLSCALFCSIVFLAACSKRERTDADEAEWADIQPLTATNADTAVSGPVVSNQVRRVVHAERENYAPLIQRLAAMDSIERASGETMITGESLVFDYERRFVRMDHNVKVVDDRGVLKSEALTGRFSENNEVEMIEARKGVVIEAEGRKATAEGANYAFESGAIELVGRARVLDGSNQLSGEKISFWIKGNRRMVCEPNALLEISSMTAREAGGMPQGDENTEIRSDRLVYDEEKALAEFVGNVRLRDPRAALNCEKVLLHLKEDNEIDWIEALSEVIIHSDGRKALADRASYYADEGKFVLDGDPKVKQGPNIMTGDRITFWQETQRMLCEPNAHMLLYPTKEMKEKFLKDFED